MGRRLDAAAIRDRSRARAWFLQVHYRWESGGRGFSLREALNETVGRRLVSPRRVGYLERLVREFRHNRHEIDDKISGCMDHWRLDRVSVMDRGALRLGATELMFVAEVPGKVVIQESVRLAGRYGSDDSPRFVNGVLDAVYRATRDTAGRG